MQYNLSHDNFMKLPFASGTVQNISQSATVEISTDTLDFTGLILAPGEKFEWHDAEIYARSTWAKGETARIAVLQLIKKSSPDDDNIATDQEVNEMLDDIFGSNTQDGDGPVDDDI